MKRTLLLILGVILALPAAAQTGWRYDGPFPADSTRLPAGYNTRYLGEPHGLAVDNAGRVWVQGHRRNLSFVHADTVLNGDVTTGASAYAKVKSQLVPVMFVYNPDGTPAPFSPMVFGVNRAGVRTDTLGSFCTGTRESPAGSGRRYRVCETRTGRGLRASPDGKYIYASYFDSIFRFDAATGAMLGKVAPYVGTTFERASLSAPGVDNFGNVYIATVAANAPVKVYSDDLTTVISAAAAPVNGVARTIDVSPDGLRLYIAAYTRNSIQMHKRANDFDPFVQAPDTVLKGIAAEAMAIHPTTGRLWVASGGGAGSGKAANAYPGFPTNYTNVTYYGFNRTEVETMPRPMRRDSITFNGATSASTPRAIAFNQAGTLAYLADFSNPAPTVQRWSFGAVAVEREGVATGVTRLLGNQPNPFTGSTLIGFTVDDTAPVRLEVFDALGRSVRMLVNETMAPGTYRAGFEADGLPSGVYFYRLTDGRRVQTGSMTLVR